MIFILGIILFISLVVLHEYGHFLVAKKNGVEVEEFGIGFPPKLFGKKMGKGIFEGYYTINLLPLGGFVKLKGENDADKRKGSLGAASLLVKAKIMLAGVAMNLVAAVFFMTLAALVGIPDLPKQDLPNQFRVESDSIIVKDNVVISGVIKGSPADKAGLKTNDIIRSIGSNTVSDAVEVAGFAKELKGQDVIIRYQRNNSQVNEVKIRLNKDSSKGYIGVGLADQVSRRSTWSAPIVGAGLTYQLSTKTLQVFGQTIKSLVSGQTKEAGKNVAGPATIISILFNVQDLGRLFFFIAIISLTLAIMNVLPIPALDGGRLAVTIIFEIIRKLTGKSLLTEKVENYIHGFGFIGLMLLSVLITILDVKRIF